MKHTQPLDENTWWSLAEYARGELSDAEQEAFEQHLIQCDACSEELKGIHATLEPLDGTGSCLEVPAAKTIEALNASEEILAESIEAWEPGEPKALGLSRAAQIPWQQTPVEGIKVKRLYVTPDGEFVTMLVRMEPGAAFPPHRHGGLEQCLVLSGDLHAGERIMTDGDFEVVEKGTVHPAQWTEHGCNLLLIASTNDEMLVA